MDPLTPKQRRAQKKERKAAKMYEQRNKPSTDENEPILKPNPMRFVLFPIKYPDVCIS
jgi:hypothetical protein